MLEMLTHEAHTAALPIAATPTRCATPGRSGLVPIVVRVRLTVVAAAVPIVVRQPLPHLDLPRVLVGRAKSLERALA